MSNERFEKWWKYSHPIKEGVHKPHALTIYHAAEAEAGVVIEALEAKLQEIRDSNEVHEAWYYEIAKEGLRIAAEWKKQGGRDD